jgi:hypothetical protein
MLTVDVSTLKVDVRACLSVEMLLKMFENNILSAIDGQIFILSAGIFRLEWKS